MVDPIYCTYIPRSLSQIIYNCDCRCIWINYYLKGMLREFFHKINSNSLIYLLCVYTYTCIYIDTYINLYTYIQIHDFLIFRQSFPLFLQVSLSNLRQACSGREKENGKLKLQCDFFHLHHVSHLHRHKFVFLSLVVNIKIFSFHVEFGDEILSVGSCWWNLLLLLLARHTTAIREVMSSSCTERVLQNQGVIAEGGLVILHKNRLGCAARECCGQKLFVTAKL